MEFSVKPFELFSDSPIVERRKIHNKYSMAALMIVTTKRRVLLYCLVEEVVQSFTYYKLYNSYHCTLNFPIFTNYLYLI